MELQDEHVRIAKKMIRYMHDNRKDKCCGCWFDAPAGYRHQKICIEIPKDKVDSIFDELVQRLELNIPEDEEFKWLVKWLLTSDLLF